MMFSYKRLLYGEKVSQGESFARLKNRKILWITFANDELQFISREINFRDRQKKCISRGINFRDLLKNL